MNQKTQLSLITALIVGVVAFFSVAQAQNWLQLPVFSAAYIGVEYCAIVAAFMGYLYLQKADTYKLVIAIIAAALAAIFVYLHSSGSATFVLSDGGAALRIIGSAALCYFGFRQRSLTTWILVAMVVGAQIGFDFPTVGKDLDVLSKIFMNLIKTVIAPLLFGTLIVGIAGHSNMKTVGRMGLRALIYFEVVTTIALFIGLLAINISQAGKSSAMQKAQSNPTKEVILLAKVDTVKNTYTLLYNQKNLTPAPVVTKQAWKDIVLHTFPENIVKSIGDGQILQIVVFCLLFAAGMMMVGEKHRQKMLGFAESLSEVMFKFTNIIMYFAPFGVGGAMAATIAKLGIGVFVNLITLLATLYVALIVFVLVVLLPIALYFKIPLRRFWQFASEPVSIAFATSSSEAALPAALDAMKRYGISDKIVSFIIPTGMSFNLDGTTLYLALAAVFVAQAANVEMTIGTQIVMMFTLMLTSKGVAGVSRASLVILAGTAASFGLPEWPIAAIMGIDALMDMARTSVNMLGNCLATAVIAKMEGEELVIAE